MLTVVEAFILTLVKEGVVSAYELNRRTGLSLGTVLPALQRLSEAKVLQSAKSGPRGRTAYRLTLEGEKKLSRDVDLILGGRIVADGDDALRLMFLAAWNGKPALAARIARSAGTELRRAAQVKRAQSRTSNGSKADAYRRRRLVLEAARLEAEARALRSEK